MVTKDLLLPQEEELTVEEINISTPSLRAASFHIGKACETENNEYMLCRGEEKDPRRCLDQGKAVTACAMKFLKQVKKSCVEEFTQYANCLDKSSKDMEFRYCRNTQLVYDKCVLDNMGLERPDFGYFCRPKVHDSKRPKPDVDAPLEFPDAPQPLPEDPVKGTARYGSRFFWMK